MAVEVSILMPNGQVQARSHVTGKIMLIREGHLFVQSYDSSTIDATVAVYAPGTWRDAGVVPS